MENQRKYKYGFVIGRFQMLHIGHEHLIHSAYVQCENLLVLVGSAQECGTTRNPFDLRVRIGMMRTLYEHVPNLYIGFINDYTHENDHSAEWGKYLLQHVNAWKNFYGIRDNLDAMVYGNDEERSTWFDPKDSEGIQQIRIERADIPISATMMRGYLAWNQYDLWTKYANPRLHGFYHTLRRQLGVK
jgi:bifunctional NMN adenylyltransferase/nudix hydrolase